MEILIFFPRKMTRMSSTSSRTVPTIPMASQVYSWYSNHGSCESMMSLKGCVAVQAWLDMLSTVEELRKLSRLMLTLSSELNRPVVSWKQ